MQHCAAAAKTRESNNGQLAHIDPTAGPRNKLVRVVQYAEALAILAGRAEQRPAEARALTKRTPARQRAH